MQEGGHHAEGHRTVAQAVHPPKEGRGVARRETGQHHRAGERRIVRTPHDLLPQAGLQEEQPADCPRREFQRADQYAVLQVFLHVALYAALGRADTAGERPHPAHIGLAEQQGRRHDEHDGAGQTHGHGCEKPERTGQLYRQYRDSGNASAQRVGDGGRVLDHPVEDVARMQCLAPGQAAFHLPFKEGAVQPVAETDFRAAAQPRAGRRQQRPYRQARHQQRDKQVHVAAASSRGRVDKAFRHPHREQGYPGMGNPRQAPGHDRQAVSARHTPQPPYAVVRTHISFHFPVFPFPRLQRLQRRHRARMYLRTGSSPFQRRTLRISCGERQTTYRPSRMIFTTVAHTSSARHSSVPHTFPSPMRTKASAAVL